MYNFPPLPDFPDPAVQRYMEELDETMDDMVARILALETELKKVKQQIGMQS